jgi:hypothetical protein
MACNQRNTNVFTPPPFRDPLLCSTRQFVGEQSGVLLFDHRIALAVALFQPFAVEHGDVAARVADQLQNPEFRNIPSAPPARTDGAL